MQVITKLILKSNISSKIFLITVIMLVVSNSIAAQGIITGRVLDEHMQPIHFANVVLLNHIDSTFIQGTITQDDGSFTIRTEQHTGILKVSSIGYAIIFMDVQQGDMGNIRMHPEIQTLGTVIVKGSRPQFKMGSDGMIINVQHSLLKQAGTADDVLSQLPLITGNNGNFTVFGKGRPLIYINNRKIYNTQELSQLKSSDIKEVTIITNPGVQYGSSAQSVILIKTIKQEGEGLSLSSYSFANISRKFSAVETIDFKYKHNQFELFSNFRIHSLHNKQYFEFEQTMQGNHFIRETGRDTIFNNGDKQVRGQLGLNYNIGKDHSFGIAYSITKSLHDVVNSTSAIDISLDNTSEELLRMKNYHTSYHSPDHEIDAYYMGKIGKLDINFNNTYFRNRLVQNDSKEENSNTSGARVIDVDNITINKMLASKVIFTYPIMKGKLSFGSEYTDAQSKGINTNAQQIFSNTDTKIKEQNLAGFAEYILPLSNFQVRAGIRYEHVVSDYYSKGVWQQESSRRYSEWFPNFSLSWNKNKWQAQLSYSTKTSRPSYRSLSSWMQYDNRYEYQGGNPLLQPAKIRTLELTATKSWIMFMIGYKNTKNQVAYVMHPYEDDIFIKTYDNIDRIQSLYASLTASPKFGFYQPMYEVRVSKQFLDDEAYGKEQSLNHPLLFIRMNNRFLIQSDFTVSVNFSYTSPYASTVSIYKAGGTLDVSVYKSFFKNKLICYFWGRDLLQTQKRRYTMYGINSAFTTRQDMDTRSFSIGIRYNFNTSRSKFKGTGAGNEEKTRLQ